MTRIHRLLTCAAIAFAAIAFAAIAFLACSAKVDPGGNSPIPDSGSDSNTGADTTTDPSDPRCEGFVPQNTNHDRPGWCLAGDDRLCLQHCAVDSCSNECNAYTNDYWRSHYFSCWNQHAKGEITDDCEALYPTVVAAKDAFDTCVLCSCDDQCPLTNKERCNIPNLPEPCFECLPEHCVNMCETFDKLPEAFYYKACIAFCANSESCILPCAIRYPAEHASYTQYLDCALESCGTACRRSDSCPINPYFAFGCSECLDTYCETECIDAVNNHNGQCREDTFVFGNGMDAVCDELFPNAREARDQFWYCLDSHCKECIVITD